MNAEQQELYVYTKDRFDEHLKRITPTCIAPLVAVRQVVKLAIGKYNEDYCTAGDNCFTDEDFKQVSFRICGEICGPRYMLNEMGLEYDDG